MALIKDIYSPAFFEGFAYCLSKNIENFDSKTFVSKFCTNEFLNKEWKGRMLYCTEIIHTFLPKNFDAALTIILKTIKTIKEHGYGKNTLPFMFFPDYIEKYGLDNFEKSMLAFEEITQFISCEFAIRPFILNYPNQIFPILSKWSKHENHHVRRLASEGSRPRLPWAIAIPFLKKDPSISLEILENLKEDESEYVRKSVANHLNDISKDNPEIVLHIADQWKNDNPKTKAIIKHGCRTLLKQGNKEILKYYNLDTTDIHLSYFKLHTSEIKVGEALHFEFELQNQNKIEKMIRLEYAIYYQKANNQLSKKVFKISERLILANQSIQLQKMHSFKIITTRKFYTGIHHVSLILNGFEFETNDFKLLA